MRPRSILLALTVAFGLALPAVAQQSNSLHRYVTFFKFTDQAVKNLTDNPQDRTAAVSKTALGNNAAARCAISWAKLSKINGTR